MAASHRRSRKGVRTFATWLAVLGALMMALGINASVASATGGNTQPISAKALSSHECDDTEWHFVITQVESEDKAPSSIKVTWANGDTENVSLDKFTGGVAHYATTSNLDSTVKSATANIYEGWSGQFNLSHGPCGEEEPPVTPEAKVTVTKDCESITVNVSGVKPEDAKVVITDNGTVVSEGTRKVQPGTHVIKVTVNGEQVFSESYTVKECETEEPPVFTHQEAVNQGSCTQLVPTVTGSTSTPVDAIGYQIVGQSPVKTIDEHDGGSFTFKLPALQPGETVKFRVVYQFNDAEPLYSEVLTFTAGTDCDEEPTPPTKVTPTAPTSVDKCETANDTYTIPSKDGVVYKVNGTVKAAGTYPGSGTVNVTAHPASDTFVLEGKTSWTFTFTNEPCPPEVVMNPKGSLDFLCETPEGEKSGFTAVNYTFDNRGSNVEAVYEVVETIDGKVTFYQIPVGAGKVEEGTVLYSTIDGKKVTLAVNVFDTELIAPKSFNTADCAVSTPPPPPPGDEKCPAGTKWIDRDGDGKVDKGECVTPVKPKPKPTPKPTPDTRPDEVSSDGVDDSSPLIPMGGGLLMIAGLMLAGSRKPAGQDA